MDEQSDRKQNRGSKEAGWIEKPGNRKVARPVERLVGCLAG